VVVASEPTGHRWRVLDQIVAECGARLVCVQPLLVHWAREAEDFTRNKNDDSDAMIIARLVTELRCYLPERADPAWARFRHLGARRAGLVVDVGAARQRVRDLLECAWPSALTAACEPLDSKSWLAAMTVVLDRVGPTGDLTLIRRWGWTWFAAAVRRELPHHGTTRWYSAIVRAVFTAATDPDQASIGVLPQGPGSLERVRFALADLAHAHAQLTTTEDLMVTVLDELGLTALATSIPGLSAVGAATILTESGDPARFSSARALSLVLSCETAARRPPQRRVSSSRGCLYALPTTRKPCRCRMPRSSRRTKRSPFCMADHPSYDTSRTIVSTSSTTLPTWRTSRESFMIRSSDVRRHEEARSSHLLPGLGRVGSASAVMHLMRHAD